MNFHGETLGFNGPDTEDNQYGDSRRHQLNPAEQCIVTIEDQCDHVGHISDRDSELAAKIPALPEGKDKHLFVSHSSDNFEEVMAIVIQLEERFNVSCIISDRDFQSGKDILENIKDSMRRSWKNVFMLTPEFVQSGLCKVERDMAFMTSVESGISTVIPVLLHECDIPTALVAVTYIDGTLPGVDIPAKIIQALIQSELTQGNMMVEGHNANKTYENAYCVAIQSQKDSICFGCKPSMSKFVLSENDLTKLRQANINLPSTILTEAYGVMNDKKRIQFDDWTRSSLKLWVWIMFTFPVFFCTFCGIFLLVFSTHRTTSVDERYVYAAINALVLSFLIGFVCIWLIVSCVLPSACNSRKQELDLQMMVWKQIGERCIQNNVIVLIKKTQSSVPTMYVMRYNIAKCKAYMAGLIRSKEKGKSENMTDPEARADEIVDRAIMRLLGYLTPDLTELPDAPYNRHNVRKSKMCICQMIEAGSPLVN